jgi:hypothetical protein
MTTEAETALMLDSRLTSAQEAEPGTCCERMLDPSLEDTFPASDPISSNHCN